MKEILDERDYEHYKPDNWPNKVAYTLKKACGICKSNKSICNYSTQKI